MVEQYIHYLAVGVANMINIFFPEVIGLSGGVANQGENLLAPLRAAVGPMVFGNAYAQKHTRITTWHPRLPRRGDWGSAAGQKPGMMPLAG